MPRKAKNTRRGNKEGTIYQRKDGTWCGQVLLGYKADGNSLLLVYAAVEKYIKAHNEIGLPIFNDLIHCTAVKTGNAKEITNGIIEKQICFDSVIAFSDMLAFEIKCVLMSVCGNCADDILIIGLDCVHSHLPLPF